MPSFDGSNIFGAAVKMTTTNEGRSTQLNSFFGLDGLEALDGGFRGRTTHVSGILYGVDLPTLATVVENFRSYDNGLYSTLVDTAGVTWPIVRLKSFNPEGRGYFHTQLGYCRNYTATFHHLS